MIFKSVWLRTSGHGMCRAGRGPRPVHRFGPPRKPPPFKFAPGGCTGAYIVCSSGIWLRATAEMSPAMLATLPAVPKLPDNAKISRSG